MKRFFVLLLILPILGPNCANKPEAGYSSQSLYPLEFNSVSVQIFENKTMNRHIEMLLADALVKEIQYRTPYRIVNESVADTLLAGTITDVELHAINQSNSTGLDNEVLIKVTVDFEWLNLANNQHIVGKKNFMSDAIFIPSRPSSEPIEMGQFAVVQQLARDIVDQMQASW